MEQLWVASQQDFESSVSAAVKRHHEEEIQLIKETLTKIVSLLESDVLQFSYTYLHKGKTRSVSDSLTY